MALNQKFNFEFLTALQGEGFTRDLKEALAIKDTWGFDYLCYQHPGLKSVYDLAKKLPKNQKEWRAANTRYFKADEVLGNAEIPQTVQDQFATILTHAKENNLTAIEGIFLMPEIRTKALVWWLWDNGTNGRWFKKNGLPAKVCDNKEGFYHSAVSTYYNRIQKGLPLYAA